MKAKRAKATKESSSGLSSNSAMTEHGKVVYFFIIMRRGREGSINYSVIMMILDDNY